LERGIAERLLQLGAGKLPWPWPVNPDSVSDPEHTTNPAENIRPHAIVGMTED